MSIHAHPAATVAAIVVTAERNGMHADVLAGHFLAEVGDDETAAHLHAALLIERAAEHETRQARALHTFWHGDDTRGETAEHADAPDGYNRVQSSTVKRRSNSGRTYSEVTVHGRSYIGGSHRGRPDRGCTMSVEHLAHALDTAPRTALGHVDGIAVSRLTDVAYPDLPRSVGADTVSWADFAMWDEVRARAPRRGHRPRMTLPRVHAGTYDAVAGPGELVTYRDDKTVFIGHRVVPRIATYRETRATRARSTLEAFTVPTVLDVIDVMHAVIPNHTGAGRWTWTAGEARGSFTLSPSGTINVNGDGVRVSKARTLDAACRSIARQVATH